ncbi:hypothetical protein DICVIV_07101 [Dictyocaulus viviparus]|uniref:Uncharacterized protein n=1 Tax=Dictyocaulus viviparus TaxID=29172 RepID=A0A0D8XWV2_DICVI|nr:hypothetical protein DICVIV_07101 [Dictyocaulus viviparus]
MECVTESFCYAINPHIELSEEWCHKPRVGDIKQPDLRAEMQALILTKRGDEISRLFCLRTLLHLAAKHVRTRRVAIPKSVIKPISKETYDNHCIYLCKRLSRSVLKICITTRLKTGSPQKSFCSTPKNKAPYSMRCLHDVGGALVDEKLIPTVEALLL